MAQNRYFEADGFRFIINPDGKSVTLSKLIDRNTQKVDILSTVNNYPVTSIGKWAFSECTGLTSVTIPDSVTSIGGYAFSGCPGLTSVTIPDSVTAIGDHAFDGCSGLKSVTIPDSVKSIGKGAFAGCTGLTSIKVASDNPIYDSRDNCNAIIETATKTLICGCKSTVIPDSVTSIGKWAFSGCTGLKSVTIGNSVTSIGNAAFSGCSGLTSVTIADSVTSIGDWAFERCSGLTSVTIPDSVTSIGISAFSGCTGLTSIKVDSGNSRYDSRDNCNAIIETATNTLICGCKSTVIPDSVTSIGSYAFSDCTGLSSITIPDTVTSIDGGAFWGCTGLTSVTIPDSVTTISWYAFSGCSGLTSVTIPDSVTTIGNEAFKGCTGLTSVTIPDSVTNIGGDAFKGTAWFDNQPDGLVYAGLVAYKYKGRMPSGTSIVLKEGTKSISDYAFYECTGLTSVTIPDSVTTIGWYAFSGCSGLTSVTIPDSVTSICNEAFNHCTGLTYVTIPESVTEIGGRAFLGCTGLKSVTIPDSVTNIGGDAFEGTAWYNNQPDGLVYAGLVAYEYKGRMPSDTSIVIKDGTKGITVEAFRGCTGLKSVTIPDSVTEIGGWAFRGCTDLKQVIFTGFKHNCKVLPEEIQKQIEILRIGSGISEMGNLRCNPKEIWCYAEVPPKCSEGVFTGFDAVLHVPQRAAAAYFEADVWRNFTNIVFDADEN